MQRGDSHLRLVPRGNSYLGPYVAQPTPLEANRMGYAIERADRWLKGLAEILLGVELKVDLLRGSAGDRLVVSAIKQEIPLEDSQVDVKFLLSLYEHRLNREYECIATGKIALPSHSPSFLELAAGEPELRQPPHLP